MYWFKQHAIEFLIAFIVIIAITFDVTQSTLFIG